MRPQYHFAATITTSAIIYYFTRSLAASLISFAGGFLIDLDHLIDYYLHEGISLRFGHFVNWCYERKFIRASLILHSLELILLLWAFIYFLELGIFWVSLAIGLTQHMLFDFIFNSDVIKTHNFYFFTARAMKGFRFKEFIRQDKIKS